MNHDDLVVVVDLVDHSVVVATRGPEAFEFTDEGLAELAGILGKSTQSDSGLLAVTVACRGVSWRVVACRGVSCRGVSLAGGINKQQTCCAPDTTR